jgi:hypothetical protein
LRTHKMAGLGTLGCLWVPPFERMLRASTSGTPGGEQACLDRHLRTQDTLLWAQKPIALCRKAVALGSPCKN